MSERAIRSAPAAAFAAAALGSYALAARTLSYSAVATTGIVGAIGLAAPVPPARARRRWVVPVLAAGVAAFAAARALGSPIGASLTAQAAAATILAAVAEEAFFRRFVYGWLEPFGAAAAVAVSTVLFGVVHVPMYGWGALGVDLGAGLVFGWQRWAAGTWLVPAATHVAANILSSGVIG